MYICICKGVNEKQIRQAVSEGDCSMQKLKCRTGLGSQCGLCRKETRTLLAQLQVNQAEAAQFEMAN